MREDAATGGGMGEPPSAGGTLEAFEAWLRAVGATWEGVRMEAVGGARGGRPCYGVRAERDLRVGDVVARIPTELCLTARTTACATLLDEELIGGTLALVFAVMHERALGEASRWWPYLRILPAAEPIPCLWEEVERELLLGTELEDMVETDETLMRQDFEQHLKPLLEKHPARFAPELHSFSKFKAAASLVSSRAFRVTSEHGDGMVPVADMFNHRTLGEHVHVTGPDDESSSEDSEEASGEASGEAAAPEPEPKVAGADEFLTIEVVKAIVKGEEVFNTFGEHGNAALLHKYGFCEPDNALNFVNLPASILEEVFDEATIEQVVDKLYRGRELEAFEVDNDGNVEPELLATVAYGVASEAQRRDWNAAEGGALGALEATEPAQLLADRETLSIVLSIIDERLQAYDEGSSGDDFERMEREMRTLEEAGNPGCTNKAAAFCLVAGEKRCLERAMVKLIEMAKAGGGKPKAAAKKRKVMTGAPYDAVVYRGGAGGSKPQKQPKKKSGGPAVL